MVCLKVAQIGFPPLLLRSLIISWCEEISRRGVVLQFTFEQRVFDAVKFFSAYLLFCARRIHIPISLVIIINYFSKRCSVFKFEAQNKMKKLKWKFKTAVSKLFVICFFFRTFVMFALNLSGLQYLFHWGLYICMVQTQPKVDCGSTHLHSRINFACNGTFKRFHKTA